MPSTLPEELIGKYLATRYQVWIDTSLVTLRIGCQSAPLAALLQLTDSWNAAYITACNPASQVVAPEENRSAMARLYETLANHSNHIYRGAGIDPAGEWPAEESLLVLDINLAIAIKIGREFGQNAIVWMDSAAIPRLVLLR
ncbi:DUF3293 domain-containing protein [Nitrosomonas sp. HPC101]|uniref:DUF3293 domain-containing protein n=1 Tax=Nitrosomonas sp. HPC101 TaxID=1658667 RepID=UPI00136FAAE0|nr:DUF3293 domain-containing protein [Nitrosomonas sp. HPC101]